MDVLQWTPIQTPFYVLTTTIVVEDQGIKTFVT